MYATLFRQIEPLSYSFFSLPDVYVKANARIKFYPTPNGGYIPWDCTIFAHDVYKRDGFELSHPEARTVRKKHNSDDTDCIDNETTSRKSFNRAKNNLFDLLQSNRGLDFFVTLTFNGEFIDRHDYETVVRKLGQWLDNNVRRKNLRYILVPEFHKDGAVHFHGFMNCDVFELIESRNPHTNKLIKRKGKQVYNIKEYKLGYSTAIRIAPEEFEATSKYVYKYITKQGGKKVGGRYYLHGGNLLRPIWRVADIDYRLEYDRDRFQIDDCKLDIGYEYKKVHFEGNLEKYVDFLRIVNLDNENRLHNTRVDV